MWNRALFTSWIFYTFLSFSNCILINGQTISSDVKSDTALYTGEFPFYTKKAFDFPLKDSLFISSVELNYAKDSLPVMYSSIISTSVCDDGLCQTLELLMYWNLIGNYLNYDTVKEVPLTKFDHLPFTRADYEKLQEILIDKNSVLERKTLDDLFDKDSVRKSNTVDAITGATAQEVKNAIVEGALYSSYKLWHIAHGSITANIRDYTKTIFTPDLGKKLLNSEDYQEQLFALKLFNDEDFSIYFDPVLELLVTSNPLVEMYILKKLPETIWQDQSFQYQLITSFPILNSNGRGILFTKLLDLDTIDASSLIFLSEQIEKMSVATLKDYFKLLVKNQYENNSKIKGNLKAASNSMEDKAFYIDNFLSN
ncbi:MAG: hypothetical protein KAQ79_22600 [Cyclobacteriaceae bacterium]|nr:hypothetical protein [Cyclobacteriaceae bacterium]